MTLLALIGALNRMRASSVLELFIPDPFVRNAVVRDRFRGRTGEGSTIRNAALWGEVYSQLSRHKLAAVHDGDHSYKAWMKSWLLQEGAYERVDNAE